MPKVNRGQRRPLLDKLERGGGFSAPIRQHAPSDYTSAKVYSDVNRGLEVGFKFLLDMVEEVFDVKLSRTRSKRRGKAKIF